MSIPTTNTKGKRRGHDKQKLDEGCQNTLKTWSGNTQIRENTYLLILAVYEACAQVVATGVHLLMCEAELSHLPRPGSVKFVCLYLSLRMKISKDVYPRYHDGWVNTNATKNDSPRHGQRLLALFLFSEREGPSFMRL